MWTPRFSVVLFIVASLLLSINAEAASASMSEYWQASDEASEVRVSHVQWQALLDAYLKTEQTDGVNRFDYKSTSDEDKQKLKQYLLSLQEVEPAKLKRSEQLAYWINFYNALTVDVVLDKYPVKSIKNIRFFRSLFGPWDKNMVKVTGQKLSLNDIEHGILRPIWQDPRIHFVVNCASIGCPNLQSIAFTADNVDALMDSATAEFINHPRAAKLQDNTLVLSSIFDWYANDFGDDSIQVIQYVLERREPNKPIEADDFSKVIYDYDWSLNQSK